MEGSGIFRTSYGDLYLQHSGYKYIKREWKNGKWRYTYDYLRKNGKTELDKYRKEFEEASKVAQNAQKEKYESSKQLYGNPNYKGGRVYSAYESQKNKSIAGRTSFKTQSEVDAELAAQNKDIDDAIAKKRKEIEKLNIKSNVKYMATTIKRQKKELEKQIKRLEDSRSKRNEEKENLRLNIEKNTNTANEYGRQAMSARYKFYQENAVAARTAYNRKLSTVLKKAVKEVVNTNSIKAGFSKFKELIQANRANSRDRYDEWNKTKKGGQ